MNVKLYALSTCGWCRKARTLLDENNVVYDLVYVDLLEKEEKDKVLEEVRKWNPRISFPTLVVNDDESVAGYKEERMRELLGL
ncbi:MAG: glutaredoxin family protein [Anaerolineae bacterium]|nr:glutaredoxin family protein [Anaerolineae bacterium]